MHCPNKTLHLIVEVAAKRKIGSKEEIIGKRKLISLRDSESLLKFLDREIQSLLPGPPAGIPRGSRQKRTCTLENYPGRQTVFLETLTEKVLTSCIKRNRN